MIYLILGDIPLLRDRHLKKIRDSYPDQDPEQFFGTELKAKTLRQATQNLSLLGGNPFVIVRAADQIGKSERDKLLGIWETVPEEVCLVLVADKADRRQKFWQQLLKVATLLSAEAPSPRERRYWLQQECQHRHLRVDAQAMQLLFEEASTSVPQLLLLLDKLEIFLNGRHEVSAQDVALCQSGGVPAQIFAWTDAVVSGQWERAWSLIQGLWAHQESPLALLALLIRHFRILLKAQESMRAGVHQREMAQILGVPPFAVARYLEQARHYKAGVLHPVWRHLQRTDQSLKSSPVPKQIELEALLWRLRVIASGDGG